MRIVEEDFIMEPSGFGIFDLTFKKKVKDENGEIQIKNSKPAYGCSLASCVNRIIKHRVGSIYESESPYLLEVLKEISRLDKELLKLCKEPIPENFDTGE